MTEQSARKASELLQKISDIGYEITVMKKSEVLMYIQIPKCFFLKSFKYIGKYSSTSMKDFLIKDLENTLEKTKKELEVLNC